MNRLRKMLRSICLLLTCCIADTRGAALAHTRLAWVAMLANTRIRNGLKRIGPATLPGLCYDSANAQFTLNFLK
ncbi:hypothetical protein DCC81_25035 [Chitinophaga parva]|uniref:Uncharacterized protein n=1 Tax=Chitinophaga parva TaxID=2169414 RepID=A0A2T7BBT1_9BACT|nr:hypothetical protein [Chitinophaga parva]PUZ21854.1 hypothetical protein DCC81_25035 [Chitinophaga parva]